MLLLPATQAQAMDRDGYAVGSIVIKTKARQLMYIKSQNEIVFYTIAVGRKGREWTGTTAVTRKVKNPSWAPPPNIRRDKPSLPAVVRPGPGNPLGAAVLVLGDGTYGIHGTNRDDSIGKAASYGCFRMHNKDVLALFEAVSIGTKVYVLK
jgi:lipoprotein-anchoring transpeptidase ErfK/SrfK